MKRPKKKRKLKGMSKQTEVNPHLVPVVVERKLGREQSWGQQWSGTPLIEIDPRQSSKKYLNTLIHEMLHMFFPDLNEKTVLHLGNLMCDAIWRKNYRRTQE